MQSLKEIHAYKQAIFDSTTINNAQRWLNNNSYLGYELVKVCNCTNHENKPSILYIMKSIEKKPTLVDFDTDKTNLDEPDFPF